MVTGGGEDVVCLTSIEQAASAPPTPSEVNPEPRPSLQDKKEDINPKAPPLPGNEHSLPSRGLGGVAVRSKQSRVDKVLLMTGQQSYAKRPSPQVLHERASMGTQTMTFRWE